MEYIKDSIRLLIALIMYVLIWFFVLSAWIIDYCYRKINKLVLWKRKDY